MSCTGALLIESDVSKTVTWIRVWNLYRAGFFNDALVSAYMALEISPTFVVIHFTVANIHASRVRCRPAIFQLFFASSLIVTFYLLNFRETCQGLYHFTSRHCLFSLHLNLPDKDIARSACHIHRKKRNWVVMAINNRNGHLMDWWLIWFDKTL